jgi:hypothetical protein
MGVLTKMQLSVLILMYRKFYILAWERLVDMVERRHIFWQSSLLRDTERN